MNEDKQTKIFQENLLELLEQSGKNQTDVADAIGVSQQTFNTWCRGIALPRMSKIQLLADYFGVMKSDLIDPKPNFKTWDAAKNAERLKKINRLTAPQQKLVDDLIDNLLTK